MESDWKAFVSDTAPNEADERILAHHKAFGLVTSPILGSKPLADQIQERLIVVRDAFGVDAVVVRTLEKDELGLLAAVGVPRDKLRDRISAQSGIVSQMLREKVTLAIEDVHTAPATAQLASAAKHDQTAFQFQAYAGAPMVVEDQVVGCLGLYCIEQTRRFSELELSYLRIVSNHLAISVVNDQLYKRLSEKAEQLKLQITEREELEEQLLQGRKLEAVGQLAGGIAHDFNNLLTVMLGNLQLGMSHAEKSLKSDHQVFKCLKQIEKAANRAATLTRQVLTFSRKNVTNPAPLNLNEMIEGLTQMLRRLITENIVLVTELDEELATVWADANQTEQVVVNLVVNAVHAMPAGGRLVIETRNLEVDEHYARMHRNLECGSYVLLAVSDTGTGIDPDIIERIFEPFYTTKAPDQGTGLGLSTVHGIVKQAGGDITVYSEVGQGTTFKVYLPVLSQPISVSVAQAEQKPTAAIGGHESILLCEDDLDVREMISQILIDNGYHVIIAQDVHAALSHAYAKDQKIDLLITDVIMPEMNGQVLSDQIRAMRPNLPTLFISGYTANLIARHGILEEGVTLLEKPFSWEILLVKIRELLDPPDAN